MKKFLVFLVISILIIIGLACYFAQGKIDEAGSPMCHAVLGNVGSVVLISGLLTLLKYDAKPENCAEHSGEIWQIVACACDPVVLRVVDVGGGGGLTVAEMVKYAVSDDGKNGEV